MRMEGFGCEDKCMCNPALKKLKGSSIYHVHATRTPKAMMRRSDSEGFKFCSFFSF